MSHEKLRSGVYNIVNLIDGKQYIGSACNLAERRNEHFRQSKSNPHLKNAFKKYGKENFEFRVLEYVEDVEGLITQEQFWIDWAKAEGIDLYNIRNKADSNLGIFSGKNNPFFGKNHTETAKRSIGIKNHLSQKGTRLKSNNPFYGKNHSSEQIAIWSSTKRGIRNPNFGKFKDKCIQGHIRTPETLYKDYSCKLCRMEK